MFTIYQCTLEWSPMLGNGFREAYLRPSFLYPAALQYQFANGVIHLLSHGRFTMKFVSEGEDMFVVVSCDTRPSQVLSSLQSRR